MRTSSNWHVQRLNRIAPRLDRIGCILHPRCTIFAYAGPIVIGDCCIIEETAVILNRCALLLPGVPGEPLALTLACYSSAPRSKEMMMIGSYNHFETGARACAGSLVSGWVASSADK